MADTERVPSVPEQAEDSKEATLPLTPVSDGDGFKHGDHEDHLDAPNETSTPTEPAGDANGTGDTLEAEHQSKDVTDASSEPVPVASPPPKPKAAVSVDARTRKTSMQVGKPDPKAASALRKTSLAKPAQPVPGTALKRSPLSGSTSAASRPAAATGARISADAASKSGVSSDPRARRTSVAPTPGHSTKPSLSSTATRPSTAATSARPSVGGATSARTTTARVTSGSKPTAPATRNSVASPTPSGPTRVSVTGARARPSDAGPGSAVVAKRPGVVRATSVSVASTRGATPTQSKAGSPAPKLDEELAAKHQEELREKIERISALEEEISSLQATLEQRQTDITNHESSLADLKAASESTTAARNVIDAELVSSKETLGLAQAEKEKIQSSLDATKNELSEAVLKLQDAESLHSGLSSRVTELETTIAELNAAHDAAKLEIEAFKEHSSKEGDAVAAAAVEHEALLKARTDLEAIRAETEALSVSHKVAAEQTELQIKELEAKISSAEALVAQLRSEISALQSERTELTNRISELEVEVLEIREANEVDADDHAKALTKLKEAHAKELVDAEARLQDGLKEATLAQQEATKKWEEAATAAGQEHSSSLEAALKSAQESATQASQQALAVLEESHAKALENLKKSSAQELAETREAHERNTTLAAEELTRLQTELNSQEEKYAAKVREVKSEHDRLVEEAYQRAKAESDAQHSKDLNALRTRSDAAIEEVRAGHRTELSNVNAAHEEALSAEVRSLEKKINSLNVDSNAARDDLAKAKATIAKQTTELNALREQSAALKGSLEKALAEPPTVAPSVELEALKNELRNVKDDFEALREVHQSSQETFAATMNNHKVELEEAAKGRVQALTALETKLEAEKSRHAEERASLQQRLDDERDAKERALATLSAQHPRTPPITPRFSGHVGGGTSKDELERLHHGHAAKLAQLEHEHKQAITQLMINVLEAKHEKEQVAEELDRKTMELLFQSSELSDTQDEVKQLQDELDRIKGSVH